MHSDLIFERSLAWSTPTQIPLLRIMSALPVEPFPELGKAIKAIKAIPEVTLCDILNGELDLRVRIKAPHAARLMEISEPLGQTAKGQRYDHFNGSWLKKTCTIPAPPPGKRCPFNRSVLVQGGGARWSKQR